MSADEIMISLTIKEGGNLDDLRKQLESLVGKRGEKIGKGFKTDVIIRDLDYIKKKINYIAPSQFGVSEMQKRATAATMLLKLRQAGGREAFRSKLLTVKDIKKFPGAEVDLDKALNDFIDEVEQKLELATKGLSLEKINNFSAIVDHVLKMSSEDVGRISGFVDQMYSIIGEEKLKLGMFEAYKKKGMMGELEKGIWKLKPSEDILVKWRKFAEEFNVQARKAIDENVAPKLQLANQKTMGEIRRISYHLGLPVGEKEIGKMQQQFLSKGYVTGKQKDLMVEGLGMRAKEFSKVEGRIDTFISLFAEKLVELLPEHAEKFKKFGTALAIEYKPYARPKDIAQMEARMGQIKDPEKNLLVMAYVASEEFRQAMERLNITLVELGSITPLLRELGLVGPEEDIKSILKEKERQLEKIEREKADIVVDRLKEEGIDISKLATKEGIDEVIEAVKRIYGGSSLKD